MWAAPAASYCPIRAGELPKQDMMTSHERWDEKLCTQIGSTLAISLVDVGSFLQPFTNGAGFVGPLGTREIDERHFADLFSADVRLRVGQRLRDYHSEHSVGAGRLVIHVGRRHRSTLVALHHEIVDLLKKAEGKLTTGLGKIL